MALNTLNTAMESPKHYITPKHSYAIILPAETKATEFREFFCSCSEQPGSSSRSPRFMEATEYHWIRICIDLIATQFPNRAIGIDSSSETMGR